MKTNYGVLPVLTGLNDQRYRQCPRCDGIVNIVEWRAWCSLRYDSGGCGAFFVIRPSDLTFHLEPSMSGPGWLSREGREFWNNAWGHGRSPMDPKSQYGRQLNLDLGPDETLPPAPRS